MIQLEEDFDLSDIPSELVRAAARQLVIAIIWAENMPCMLVGDELETGILLMLKGQETNSKH